MWNHLARIILEKRIILLILLFGATIFMGMQATKVKITDEVVGLLPRNDIEAIEYKNFKTLFGNDANLILIGVADSSLFTLTNFSQWVFLADSLKNIEGVSTVFSIQHAFKFYKNNLSENFETKSLLEKDSLSRKNIFLFLEKLNELPFYDGLIYNKKTGATTLVVEMSQEVIENELRYNIISLLEKQVALFNKNTKIKTHISGFPYIRTIKADFVKQEIGLFVFLAALVTALISLLFFRSFRATMISMLIVGAGVIFSLGIMALLDYEITILSALIPPLIIVIGIPNCVFLINKYHHEYRSHGNKARALSQVVEKTGNAILFTNTTTAAGFATFVVTRTPMLVEFGILASLSILSVFVLSLIIVPTLYSFLSPPKKRHMRQLQKRWLVFSIDVMKKIVLYKREQVFLVSGLILVIAILGITRIETTGNFSDDLPSGSTLLEDLQFFETHFNGIMPFDILIDTKRKNGATKINSFNKIEELHNELKIYPEFSRPFSVVDLIKFFKQSFYNNNPDFYSIPNSQEKNWILSYVDKSNFNNPLFLSFVDSTNRYARVSASIADIGTTDMEVLKDSLMLKVTQIFEPLAYDVHFTGFSVIFLKSTKYLIRNLFMSLLIAIVLIAVFMAVLFDSSRMVLVSLIPNIIPLIITAALMGFFSISIKPSTLLVFSIAFGISIDDTIHFLAKYRQELYTTKNVKKAVVASLEETGVSMIFTSIILFFGFGVFIASQFGGTQALGLLVSITLLVAMLCNLILLPCLLLSFEKRIHADFFSNPKYSNISNTKHVKTTS